MTNETNRKKKKKMALWFSIFIALLGGIGVGLQNTLAVFDLLTFGGIIASSAIPCALLAGGICSTLINFFLNADLLANFWERISKKPLPDFHSNGQQAIYWLGIIIFIITGILFGLTAFSVAESAGGISGLDGFAIAGMVAGIFVALISVPQELETWLASFDHPVTVELGKAIYELEGLDSALDVETKIKTKQEILRELCDSIEAKVAQQFKNFINLSDSLKKSKLNDLRTWFGNNQLVNLHIDDCIKKIEEKKAITKKELNDFKNLINSIFQSEIRQCFHSVTTTAEQKEKSATIANLQKFKLDIVTPIQEKQKVLSLWRSFRDYFINWKDNISIGRFVGLMLSLANVMSLSLLFTIGITTFLNFVGVPPLTSLITGFCLAFTAGAYTEFYFYHYFLADFCDQIGYKWKELTKTPSPSTGIILVGVNAAVNGGLAYFSIQMLGNLFLAAGMTVPSLVPLCIASAIFASAASFLLGADFWIQNAKRFANWLTGSQQENTNQDNDTFFSSTQVDKIVYQPVFSDPEILNTSFCAKQTNIYKLAYSTPSQ